MPATINTEQLPDQIQTSTVSVVLISAGNIREIKKAYPNYFLDTTLFVRALGRLCAKYR